MAHKDISVVGVRSRLRGRISGEGSIVVEGQVEGDLAVSGSAEIAAGGSVHGDVDATDLDVAGTLDGNVRASGTVTIGGDGSVRGDVTAARIAVEPGATVALRLDMVLTND